MPDTPIMEVRNVSKTFHGIYALKDINLKIYPGEIHAICGENGAGKSTLMNVLTGLYAPDGGQIYFNGKPCIFKSPRDSQNLGIQIVHQELSLCPHLSVAENIFLGSMPLKSMSMIDKEKMYEEAGKILKKFNSNINPKENIDNLTVSHQQLVEIVKAVSKNCKVLILDEPTSALTDDEVNVLMKNLKLLQAHGIAILYISHRLNEIVDLCQRVTILRDGKQIRTDNMKDITLDDIITSMVGRKMTQIYPEKGHTGDKVMLDVKNLTHNKVYKDVSFKLYNGEILGIFGLMGAGRTEVARGICGIDPVDSGEVIFENQKLELSNIRKTIDKGIVYITEDRKTQGLFLKMSIKSNVISTILKKVSKSGMVKKDMTESVSEKYARMMNTKCSSLEQNVVNLSGGNQQKVLLAKWLSAEPKILILDEPTRGIDVGAKFEIHQILRKLCNSGHGVIVISSDLPEILGLCDRILVMHEGKMVGQMSGDDANEEEIMKYASGTKTNL